MLLIRYFRIYSDYEQNGLCIIKTCATSFESYIAFHFVRRIILSVSSDLMSLE